MSYHYSLENCGVIEMFKTALYYEQDYQDLLEEAKVEFIDIEDVWDGVEDSILDDLHNDLQYLIEEWAEKYKLTYLDMLKGRVASAMPDIDQKMEFIQSKINQIARNVSDEVCTPTMDADAQAEWFDAMGAEVKHLKSELSKLNEEDEVEDDEAEVKAEDC